MYLENLVSLSGAEDGLLSEVKIQHSLVFYPQKANRILKVTSVQKKGDSHYQQSMSCGYYIYSVLYFCALNISHNSKTALY